VAAKLRLADSAMGKQQRRLAARDIKGCGGKYQECLDRRDLALGITAQPYSTVSHVWR
jgi:hypothetical protein